MKQECELDICLEKRKKDPKIPDCDQFLLDITRMYERLKSLGIEDDIIERMMEDENSKSQ